MTAPWAKFVWPWQAATPSVRARVNSALAGVRPRRVSSALAWERHDLILSSGRRIYAGANGALGITADGWGDGGPRVSLGYDHWLDLDGHSDELEGGSPLSPAERAEMADYAIALWTRWKAVP